MKKKSTYLKILLISFFLIIGKWSEGQTFDCYIANDVAVNSTTFEFDVFIKNTSTTPFLFRTIQMAFYVNPAWLPAGAAPTITLIPNSTGLLSYSPGSILSNSSPSLSGFVVAANSAGTCGSNSLFSPNANIKIGRFSIISNSGPMNCVPNNISMIRPITADATPGGNVNIKMAVTKWSTTDCSVPTSVTISSGGTYTSIAGGTLLNDFNNMRPTITGPVASAVSCANQGSVSFSVSASSISGQTTPLSYQWLENGLPVSNGGSYSGATTSTLTITNPPATLTNNSYSCTVTQCSSRTSSAAILSVSNPDDNNPCTIDACNPLTGTVSHSNASNGTPGLSDGLVCTDDICFNGNTIYSAVNIDDSNPCTNDGCSESRSIFHDPVPLGSPGQSDGLVCTNDVCNGSGITIHNALPVDDSNPCTTDGCSEPGGIFHINLTNTGGGASDGLICTQDNCANGLTVHPAVPVNDNNPCTIDACDETNGVTNIPTALGTAGISDGLVCTNDVCDGNGITLHNAVPVDDSNPCTTDGCSEPSGIYHTNLTNNGGGNSDGLICTQDNCANGVTVHPAVPVDDSNPCTLDGCDETNGVTNIPTASGTPGASDGLVCTNDVCDGNGITLHNAVPVDDSNPCTTDGCSEPSGIYHTNLTNNGGGNSDGLICTQDNCANGITVHPGVPVDDSNPCTLDGCDETNGVTNIPTALGTAGISDGLVCTNDVCDGNGITLHNAVPVDDSNPCTTDGCSEPSGIYHTNLTNNGGGSSDGLICTQDNCTNGVTVHPAVPVDDSNPCTLDGCDETNGVTNIPTASGTPGASDGLVCTNDVCDGNGNTLHNAVPVDDFNPCTNDGCSEPGGVYNTPLSNTGGGNSDGLICTQDNCANGVTVHPAVPVDDSNPCTLDGCDETNGVTNIPTALGTAGISDGLVCTEDVCDGNGNTLHNSVPVDDFNPCTNDGCSEPGGVYNTPLTNTGGGNSDGLICTQDNCANGVTVHPAVPVDDSNPCTLDGCDETNGVTNIPTALGTAGISDGLVCTEDVCDGNGNTLHNAVPVDDFNPCTNDGCSEPGGVYNTPLTNTGGGNSDGLICTQDNCANGITVHPAVPVDDSNPCTLDGCDETNGVTNIPTALGTAGISDGLVCTEDVCDGNGNTLHNAVPVDDFNPCTNDGCSEPGGVYNTPLTNTGGGNSDGLICTQDNCANGITVHPAVPVDDSNPCTLDGCDETNGVTNIPTALGTAGISDGLVCTEDVCDGNGNTLHNAVPVDDFNPCTNDGCSEPGGVYNTPLTNTGGGNSDGLICTQDNCANGITVHPAVLVDDSNPCTLDGCDETNGVTNIPTALGTAGISDGLVCTEDVCDGNGNTLHNAVPVDDFNPCTNDGCSEPFGVYNTPLTNTGGGSSDGLICTQDNCANGITVHPAVPVNDNNPCTIDACDETNGITNTPTALGTAGFSDGQVCTNDICNGNGLTIHNAVPVDDSNPCTTDGCSEPAGVYHTNLTNNGGGASDGLICTQDNCANGVSLHPAVPVNDNNPCTIDGCDETNGVTNIPVADGSAGTSDGLVCTDDVCQNGITVHNPVVTNDNNACTLDACTQATGVTHTPVNINDGDACTIDACNTLTGVSHLPVNQNDGNACTTDGCISTTGVYHTPVVITDNDNCTIDGCNTLTGIITHNDNTPLVTAVAGTISCYQGTTCVLVSATGGSQPYVGTGQICNVSAGTSSFTISDNNGCQAISNVVTIIQPSKLVITSTTSTPAGCAANDGTATANVSGGASPYSYLWTPGNKTTATATGLSAGTYAVKVTDANGCSTSGSVVVGTGGSVPLPPSYINGLSVACRNNCYTYSITSVTGATSYQWTLPSGASGSSSGTSITVCFNDQFSGGYLCVRALSPCGPSAYTCKSIVYASAKPNTTSVITGNIYVCTNSANQQTYCVVNDPNVTNYTWTIGGSSSSPLTIVSGQGTSCVKLNIPAGYNGNQSLKVVPSNCRGTGGNKSVNIKKVTSAPSQPGNMSGNTSYCKSNYGKSYSVGSVSNASYYTWTATGGATISTGQGTTGISVDFRTCTSSTVVLSVVAVNGCGTSVARTKTVSINLNCKINADGTDDVSANTINSLEAYPNPTTGHVKIAFEGESKIKYSLKIVDVIGRVMFNETVTAVEGRNEKDLNLENSARGIYFITIQNEAGEVNTLRLIVQ